MQYCWNWVLTLKTPKSHYSFWQLIRLARNSFLIRFVWLPRITMFNIHIDYNSCNIMCHMLLNCNYFKKCVTRLNKERRKHFVQKVLLPCPWIGSQVSCNKHVAHIWTFSFNFSCIGNTLVWCTQLEMCLKALLAYYGAVYLSKGKNRPNDNFNSFLLYVVHTAV